MGERKVIYAGELFLLVTDRASRGDLVKMAFLAFLGRLQKGGDFDALITKQITIETRSPQTSVSTDGEVRKMDTPLNYLISPGALRVIVPVEKVPETVA